MISYQTEGVKMPDIKKKKTTGWIKEVAACYGKRVRSNAEQFEQPYDRKLHRVIINGILHLCGINDKGPGEREIMEAAENKALALISL